MKLVKDEILEIARAEEALRNSMNLKKYEKDVQFQIVAADLNSASKIAESSETIIFPTDTFLQILHTLNKIDLRMRFLLPYPNLIVQLTEPVPEKDVMPYPDSQSQVFYLPGRVKYAERIVADDRVSAVLLRNPFQSIYEGKERLIYESVLWFTSLAMDRSGWILDKIERIPIPTFNSAFKDKITKEQYDNKYKIIQIAYGLSLFFNAPNVLIERKVTDKKVNEKRRRKGKAPIPEYHTVYIKKVHVEYESKKGTGTPHGRMYPVRGHFRKYKHLDKPVWIPNHYRGLQHGEQSMKKEIYRVKKEGKTSND